MYAKLARVRTLSPALTPIKPATYVGSNNSCRITGKLFRAAADITPLRTQRAQGERFPFRHVVPVIFRSYSRCTTASSLRVNFAAIIERPAYRRFYHHGGITRD